MGTAKFHLTIMDFMSFFSGSIATSFDSTFTYVKDEWGGEG